MRECIQMQVGDLRLQGTVHRGQGAGGRSRDFTIDGTGVLLLNSGFLPRSAQGDLLARLADRLAASGFEVFRFDLPGLGESEGDLPEDAVTFVQKVEKGGFGPCIASLAQGLAEDHGLGRIVIGGLCGGGMSAMFGASQSGKAPVAGVMMLDPIFKLVQIQEQPGQKKPWLARCKEDLRWRTRAAYEELRVWILARRLAAPLQKIYSKLKAARIAHRSSRPTSVRQRPPEDSNWQLIECFERLMAEGLPVLVVTAHDPRRAGAGFDFMQYLLGEGPFRVEHRYIEGTNHSFLEGGGPRALLDVVDEWTNKNFAGRRATQDLVARSDAANPAAALSAGMAHAIPASPRGTAVS